MTTFPVDLRWVTCAKASFICKAIKREGTQEFCKGAAYTDVLNETSAQMVTNGIMQTEAGHVCEVLTCIPISGSMIPI